MRSIVPTYSSDLFKYNKEKNTLYTTYSALLGNPPIDPFQRLDPDKSPSLLGFNIRSERTGQVIQFMLDLDMFDHEGLDKSILISTGDLPNHRQLTLQVVVLND